MPHREPDWSPRVLVLPSSYFAESRTVGGGERYAQEYARALARVTPTTMALFNRTPGVRSEGPLKIRTFALRETGGQGIFPLTRSGLEELKAYDILHLMVFPTPLSDLLTVLGKLRGQTIVLTDVGGGLPSITTYLQRLHPRLGISRLADGLALLSKHSTGHFADWRQPRTILYGGADLFVRDTGGPATDEPYALFVGRLLAHKGVLELIEAIDAATSLHVVGRPYDAEYLRQLQEAARGKRIRFILDADDAELRRQYLGARVVLQPSIPVDAGPKDTSELLGLVTIEGMSYGKPVVVTQTGSLPELVQDGVTGFIVQPRDPAGLRSAIERLMRDPGLAERLGAAARTQVAERFTWNRVAQRGMDFYAELSPHR